MPLVCYNQAVLIRTYKREDAVNLLPNAHAELIRQAVTAAQAAGDLPTFDLPTVEIKPPKNADQGDYAYAGAMALAKDAKRAPRQIAKAIVQHLPAADFVDSVEIAGPGFINFRLSQTWLRDQVKAVIAEGDALAALALGAGKRAQVEFVSANPTGPLHIGRSRGAIVGDTMARLLEAAGYAVQREYYFNNAGNQMRNLGESLRLRYLEAVGEASDAQPDYQGSYLIDIAQALAADPDPALTEAARAGDWQPFKEAAEARMFAQIKATLARIDIVHDHFFNEQSLYESRALWDTLAQLEGRGHVYESAVREGEGAAVQAENADLAPAKWFRSTAFGDTEDRVLVKGDGSPTYTLPDIAYHVDKLKRQFDLLVNVLGADHFVQAQVVRRGLEALGYDPDPLHVILMQFVRLIRDGKEHKMSTRAGNYETLDDLIDQTSADAVRYILLARSTDSRIDFDLDLAVKKSSDNPVYYIQYAHVRCAGILREAALRGLDDSDADLSLLDDEALAFLRKILTLPEEIERAVTNFAPHGIAFYALDLANTFHPMYDRVRVFGEGVPQDLAAARLHFYRAAQVAFKRVLTLMGMSTPERM